MAQIVSSHVPTIGSKLEPGFGPVIMLGMGGIYVEVRVIGYRQTDTIKIEIKKNENINLRIFLEQSLV